MLSRNLFRVKLFQYRGYTPIPFLLAMIVFARPEPAAMLIGGVLVILGELVRFWGVAYAGSLTRVTGGVGAPEVIVAGPFAYVRNPLYVGNILLYAGVGVMSNALFPWLVLVAAVYFIFQYYEIVLLEEEFLRGHFGAAYEDFAGHVPRFIPRLTRYNNESQSHQHPDWIAALRSERRTLQAIGLVLVVLIFLWLWR